MANITFEPSGKHIEIPDGSRLIDAARSAGLPVASSCGEELICGKCRMKILQGSDQVSPPTSSEEACRKKQSIPNDERLSCATKVFGNTKVSTSYW